VRVLVLGGTVFLGRHVVETALARGDEVAMFNRGVHGPDLYPEVERLHGDRDGGLEALRGREWDAVVDTSGYFPRVVGASAELLADAVGHYTFISSGSVYADFRRPGIDERSPTLTLAKDTPEELSSPEAYGGFKAQCERAVEKALPGRALSVRAGILAGPYDPTNRFTDWVSRIDRGGEVLAPEPRDQPVQILDARDLCAWILRMAEGHGVGIYGAVGPVMTLEELLERIRAGVDGNAELVWAGERFLVDAGVEPFQDLPLWLAPTSDPAYAGFLAVDGSKALAAGLEPRPVEDTARDTLAWARSGEEAGPKDVGVAMAPAGLAPERERELLDAWRRQAA
jgi:2'-hydroxyisoflavone reductase